MSSIAFTELGVDDWRRWRAVRLAALGEAPDAFRSRHADWAQAPEQRYRERLLAVPYNVVAVVDDEDIAMAAATPPDAARVSDLHSLWVAPEHRGKGIAEALIDRVAQWAHAQGATTLRLGVRTHNMPAITLYRRLGFRHAGVDTVEDGPPEHIMTMPLPAQLTSAPRS